VRLAAKTATYRPSNTRQLREGSRSIFVTVAAAGLLAGTAMAFNSGDASLNARDAHSEYLRAPPSLAINNPLAVFAFVLGSLPNRVKINPTGNYYYFNFNRDGTLYAGNIRLDALYRDSGKVHFAYYPERELARWAAGGTEQDPFPNGVGVILDASRGVTVERLMRLVYRVTDGRKSVVFTLNDLSKVRPPANALAPDETFLGPIFDESGIRFFLVYSHQLKIFHYILDETVEVMEKFVSSRLTDRIIIGKRTGFAFYWDQPLNRKILIGVLERNRRANNYFDGPFDQLPDNFIEGEALREMILEVEPSLRGRIDRLGRTFDYAHRYTIAPYIDYRKEDELYLVEMCVDSRRARFSDYRECFADSDNGATINHGPGS
jgi:hypothetical protein